MFYADQKHLFKLVLQPFRFGQSFCVVWGFAMWPSECPPVVSTLELTTSSVFSELVLWIVEHQKTTIQSVLVYSIQMTKGDKRGVGEEHTAKQNRDESRQEKSRTDKQKPVAEKLLEIKIACR